MADSQMVQNSACRAILHINGEFHNYDSHNEYYCLEFFVPVMPVTGHVTRFATNKNMKVPLKRTNTGKKAFQFRGPDSWNQLDVSIKSIDLNLFI